VIQHGFGVGIDAQHINGLGIDGGDVRHVLKSKLLE
jgi:hypothetical protein